MEYLLDHEKHFAYRLFFYAVVFIIAFFTVAAVLEECGYSTNVDFGWNPVLARRFYIILSALSLPFIILIPDLGFRLYLKRETRTLSILRLSLFWTRRHDSPLAGATRLLSKKRIRALRVLYDVGLLLGEEEEMPLFTLSRQEVEEAGLDRELARKLNLQFGEEPPAGG